MTDTVICNCGYSFDHQYLKENEVVVKDEAVVGCICRNCGTVIMYDESTPIR